MRKFIIHGIADGVAMARSNILGITLAICLVFFGSSLSPGQSIIPELSPETRENARIVRELILSTSYKDYSYSSSFPQPCDHDCKIRTVIKEMKSISYDGREGLSILPSDIIRRRFGSCYHYTIYFICRMLYTEYRGGLGFIVLEHESFLERKGHIAPIIAMRNNNIYVYDFSGNIGAENFFDYIDIVGNRYARYGVYFMFPKLLESKALLPIKIE